MQHRFCMRETIYANANTRTLLPTAPVSGGAAGWSVITSSGLESAYYDLASTTFKIESAYPPVLRWLSTQAQNFAKFRIIRAAIVIVGCMGSDLNGKISIQGFNDVSDIGTINVTNEGINGKLIDVSSLSVKESRFELPINSEWKKITNRLVRVGGEEPFASPGNRCVIPCNSANDLLVTGFGYRINGANTTERVCEFYLDYEVEFSGPLMADKNG